MTATPQRIALLGSTGSIGEQALEIVRTWPQHFTVTLLTARKNWQQLARQASEFLPDSVVIADKSYYPELKEALSSLPVKVYAGADAIEQSLRNEHIDTVINAIVGYAGLGPTISALRSGKKLALANKESLVVAGDIVIRTSLENNAPIIPIDSEHSAIFQCLAGEASSIKKLVLTASGGPFLDTPSERLRTVTVEDALAHPRWNMGAKISIDSATMINKGFEVIEAHWLFGMPPEKIEVVVHPESVIHSMVEFEDGALKAQLGEPDMKVPISYALTFPYRMSSGCDTFDITSYGALNFRKPDILKFPCLEFAYEALRGGGNRGCVLNSANEAAVEAFMAGKIAFTQIAELISFALERTTHITAPTLEDHQATDAEVRALVTAEYLA